jgi:hypothetical protein
MMNRMLNAVVIILLPFGCAIASSILLSSFCAGVSLLYGDEPFGLNDFFYDPTDNNLGTVHGMIDLIVAPLGFCIGVMFACAYIGKRRPFVGRNSIQDSSPEDEHECQEYQHAEDQNWLAEVRAAIYRTRSNTHERQ